MRRPQSFFTSAQTIWVFITCRDPGNSFPRSLSLALACVGYTALPAALCLCSCAWCCLCIYWYSKENRGWGGHFCSWMSTLPPHHLQQRQLLLSWLVKVDSRSTKLLWVHCTCCINFYLSLFSLPCFLWFLNTITACSCISGIIIQYLINIGPGPTPPLLPRAISCIFAIFEGSLGACRSWCDQHVNNKVSPVERKLQRVITWSLKASFSFLRLRLLDYLWLDTVNK